MHEEIATDSLAALGNRTRLRVYRLLVRAGDEGLNFGTIQRLADAPASTLAHHLSALTHAGLVAQERQGREVISRANFGTMRDLIDYLTEACCAGVDAEDGEVCCAAVDDGQNAA